MGRHKLAKNCNILPWVSGKADCKEGRFIQIGNSLLLSKEYQALSSGAGRLYLCMAMESGGKREFNFTRGIGKKYGFAVSSYERYVKELKTQGFIEQIDNPDMAQYAPGSYRFIFDWKGITSTR